MGWRVTTSGAPQSHQPCMADVTHGEDTRVSRGRMSHTTCSDRVKLTYLHLADSDGLHMVASFSWWSPVAEEASRCRASAKQPYVCGDTPLRVSVCLQSGTLCIPASTSSLLPSSFLLPRLCCRVQVRCARWGGLLHELQWAWSNFQPKGFTGGMPHPTTRRTWQWAMATSTFSSE